jgi:hypothetical protein
MVDGCSPSVHLVTWSRREQKRHVGNLSLVRVGRLCRLVPQYVPVSRELEWGVRGRDSEQRERFESHE